MLYRHEATFYRPNVGTGKIRDYIFTRSYHYGVNMLQGSSGERYRFGKRETGNRSVYRCKRCLNLGAEAKANIRGGGSGKAKFAGIAGSCGENFYAA